MSLDRKRDLLLLLLLIQSFARPTCNAKPTRELTVCLLCSWWYCRQSSLIIIIVNLRSKISYSLSVSNIANKIPLYLHKSNPRFNIHVFFVVVFSSWTICSLRHHNSFSNRIKKMNWIEVKLTEVFCLFKMLTEFSGFLNETV